MFSEWVTDDDDAEDSQDVTLVTSDDDGEGGESCPICLNKFRDQDIGTPESCDHCFCLECIQEWANVCLAEFVNWFNNILEEFMLHLFC